MSLAITLRNYRRFSSELTVSIGSVKIAPKELPPEKLPPIKFSPRNCHQWKLHPMKILTYESPHPLKFPPSENRPLENFPQENYPRKLIPRKLSPMKVATIVVRNWKLLPCDPYVIMKNKAWWPVWWSWVSWKYRYLFNLTWIVVFL